MHMNAQESAGRLLLIDSNAQMLEALRQHFESHGYQVQTAVNGADGLVQAQTGRPNLILLAMQLPDKPGLDVFRELRDTPRTGHLPVMMLAGGEDILLRNSVLAEGAHDFIEQPVDLDILELRVRNALRRVAREELTESRTGLPTGRLIQERVRQLDQEVGWYRVNLRIAEFGAFRDLYGFVTANEALRFAGNLVCQIVNEQGNASDFVGHVSGAEEFVIITTQDKGPGLSTALQQRVSKELQSFYNFVERDQGYVVLDEGERQVQKPLMSAEIFTQHGEPDLQAASLQPDRADPWIDVVEPNDDVSSVDEVSSLDETTSIDEGTSTDSTFDW
jgi:DNA-binding response OmpR family regulator